MLGRDRLDLVVPQEPCDPGMMSALGAPVMEDSPGNGELLPAADLAADHISDRYAISPAPARASFTIGGNSHAHGRGQRPAQLATPDAGRDQSLQHALQNILTRTPCGMSARLCSRVIMNNHAARSAPSMRGDLGGGGGDGSVAHDRIGW